MGCLGWHRLLKEQPNPSWFSHELELPDRRWRCPFAAKAINWLWRWGFNGSGRLGEGTATNRLSPIALASWPGPGP